MTIPISLSPRLERMLDLAARGFPDKAIADEMEISPHTVDAGWRRVRMAYGAANRSEAVARHVEARQDRRIAELCGHVEALEQQAATLREANARLSAALEARGNAVVERFEASARAVLAERDDVERLRRLEEAVEAGGTVLYEGEIGGLWRKRWTTENCAAFGFSAASFVEGETRIADLVPAEDMMAVMGAFERALAEGEDALTTYYRIRLPDGTLRWVKDRMTLVRDERGEPVRYYGCATDVTELAERCDPAHLPHPPAWALSTSSAVGPPARASALAEARDEG